MISRAMFFNSRPGGVAVLEIAAGPEEPREAAPRFVPLQRTELRGEIVGPLAALQVTHVYGFGAAQFPGVLEAIYRFPLPGDAAVTGVTVRFGDVEIRAELRERKQAEQEYDEAKTEGRQAALLARESPDVFTLRIAGIMPDQEVRVVTSYVQLAQAAGAGWSLRIPLTTAPRYSRSDEYDTRHAAGQPLLLFRDPGHRFTLDLRLSGAAEVESSTHRLAVGLAEGGASVVLADGEVVPDRDCVLTWRPQQAEARPVLSVRLHAEPDAGYTYFLAQVAPPSAGPGQPAAEPAAVAREVILLVDHSGSMSGAKWAAADWAVKQFLAGLAPQDAFNLGLFHNTTRWFQAAPVRAGAEEIAAAARFLEKHRDSGGTELGVALEQALDQQATPGETTRHLLIVTDAQVTDAGRLLRLAERSRGPQGPGARGPDAQGPDAQGRRRISLLCIDAAPNAALAVQLAERGGGVARFLTSAPDEDDITMALEEVLAEWAAPAAAGLSLAVNRPGVQAAGRQTSGGSIDLGDLPYGRTIWVAGRLEGADTSGLEWRLAAGGRDLAALAVTQEASPCPQIKALFGAARTLALEYLMEAAYPEAELRSELARLGYDPVQVLGPVKGGREKVYAENQRRAAAEALRSLLVREALEFGLATAETAFVAVRTEAGKPVEAAAIIGNALPAGWSEDFLLHRGGSMPMARVAAPTSAGGFKAFRDGAVLASAAPALDVPAFLRSSRPGRGAGRTSPAAPAFSGVPAFSGGQAVLLDTTQQPDAQGPDAQGPGAQGPDAQAGGGARVPEAGQLSELRVAFPAGAPRPEDLGSRLELLLYVDDLSAPRVRVRLADLVRQGGVRPVNLRRERGQLVRLVLLDPAGAWPPGAAVDVTLVWLGTE